MIKLSVAIAGKHALPSAFVVFRGFEESIEKAADMGYDGGIRRSGACSEERP